MKWIKKHRDTALLLALYAAALVLFLAVHLVGFVANRVLHANGTLAETELTVEDFTLEGLMEHEGGLVTTTSDPQMLLKDSGRRVDSLYVEFDYARAPLVSTAFWAKPGQGHSLRRMAYSQQGAGQLFYLPATGGQSLRLDPDTVAGNRFEIKRMVLNPKRPFLTFFIPRAGELALYLVVPGLAACLLVTLRRAGLFAGRKAGGAHG